MTQARIVSVLTEIIELLEQCRRATESSWLAERRAVLLDPASDSHRNAMSELHGIVPGMGGLMDLELDPPPAAPWSSRSARERLDVLADELYELTRPSPAS